MRETPSPHRRILFPMYREAEKTLKREVIPDVVKDSEEEAAAVLAEAPALVWAREAVSPTYRSLRS